MAEALILVLLQKIATTLRGAAQKAISSQLGKEATLLFDVENSMREVECEFDVMQAFISQVDPYCTNNQVFQSWLKHIRMVTFEVEDIVDEYAFLLGKMNGTESFLRKTLHKSKKLKVWYSVASRLRQVKSRVQNLTVMKERYGIKISDNDGTSSGCTANRQIHSSNSSYLNYGDDDDNAMVGQKDNVQRLTKHLNASGMDRSIITIHGMGGSGKTTLARSIYRKQDITKKFDCHAWITVSRNYQIEDLLMSIMDKLKIGHRTDINLEEMVQAIHTYLENKRYLIVLDDMWDRDSWSCFEDAFPRRSQGSKVIITTRNKEVAKLVELQGHIISLNTLLPIESWDLFCKKAFSKLPEAKCPEGLIKRAEEILEKCEGLPLAIVAIGSLLSYRGIEEKEWASFYDQLNWQLTYNPELSRVSNVLSSSLNDLPTHLKNCFLYCGLFPEDRLIRRKWIIRMWIAEGFVEDRGTETTLEEVAEDYLKELTQRSLIQVVERNEFGRPRRFKLHNMVREITWMMSKRQRFALICDDPDVTSLGDAVRRVPVHKGGQHFQPSASWQQLRSFLLFDKHVSISWICNASSNFRLLRVLCLRYSLLKDFPNAIVGLFNLHYLDLSRTKVNKIPKSVARLKNLQTLHLRRTSVSELPCEITLLACLRHLSVSTDLYGTSFSGNVYGLRSLHTLKEIKASKNLVQNLSYLTQLRSLSITNVLANHNRDLWSSIGKLKFLTRLAVSSRDDDEVLDLENFRAPQYLEKFYLDAKLANNVLFPISGHFQNLKLLSMRFSHLVQDPLISLCKMANLVCLELNCAYDGEALRFCAEWFPKLKQLSLEKLENLKSIDIIDGTMVNLTYLKLSQLWNLHVVPIGLTYLKMLHHLFAESMPDVFIRGLAREGFLNNSIIIECV
ncbi:disease resistance protein RPM1 [Oryza sativa Japonica Group]|uniref:Os12g0500500 protein n=7 Tax=Oryza TaxID=4527 RepID=A0A8J8XI52_ORYSJ|nr:disease resistance protein RPM1 [Oryza sativa Japonica Group]ABA99009.1 NB-ARC domain containing protein, expressed [Oryza sativa Japonica Group]EAZ20575.1 hypothetical protein OsJ_36184 [Oryza sativa Japonica Group]BAF29837.1 Os12g0500500 [Oryza sativa Japonica Group]BAT17248.1 Os12g0500500 [Oryza sativa Japonica Group]|eukprot:NP_001066818.1 Os12g0500500 [Oryza sativa Japonica Group]